MSRRALSYSACGATCDTLHAHPTRRTWPSCPAELAKRVLEGEGNFESTYTRALGESTALISGTQVA